MPRTIGIMATYPPRLGELQLVVPSIAPQLDRLVVVANQFTAAPRFARRLTNVECILPERDLRDEGKFVDVGAASDDILFYLDDDIIYPHDYVSRMLGLLEKYGEDRVALGVHGIIYSDFFDGTPGARLVHVFDKALPAPMVVNQIGTGTAVVKAALAPSAEVMAGSATFVDVRFAGHCHAQGTGLVCVSREAGWLRELPTQSTIFETVTSQTGALEHICAEIDGFGGIRRLPLDLVQEIEGDRPLVPLAPRPVPPAPISEAGMVAPAARTAPEAARPVQDVAPAPPPPVDHIFAVPEALEPAALTQLYRLVMGAHAAGATLGLHVADQALIDAHWQLRTLSEMPAVQRIDAVAAHPQARALAIRPAPGGLDIAVLPASAYGPKAGRHKPARSIDTHILARGLEAHLDALGAMPPESGILISNSTFGRFWNLQDTVFNLCHLRGAGLPAKALVLTGGFWEPALLADIRAVALRTGRTLFWLRQNVEEIEEAAGVGPQSSGQGWELHVVGADLTPDDDAFTQEIVRRLKAEGAALRLPAPEQGEARTGAEFFSDLVGGALGDLSRNPLRMRTWPVPG